MASLESSSSSFLCGRENDRGEDHTEEDALLFIVTVKKQVLTTLQIEFKGKVSSS